MPFFRLDLKPASFKRWIFASVRFLPGFWLCFLFSYDLLSTLHHDPREVYSSPFPLSASPVLLRKEPHSQQQWLHDICRLDDVTFTLSDCLARLVSCGLIGWDSLEPRSVFSQKRLELWRKRTCVFRQRTQPKHPVWWRRSPRILQTLLIMWNLSRTWKKI